MDRKELYAKVKELCLQDKIKINFGKNFTQVSSNDLEMAVAGAMKSEVKTVETPQVTVKVDTAPKTEQEFEAACLVFLGVLKDTGKLDYLLNKL